jgi:hypothetical protein
VVSQNDCQHGGPIAPRVRIHRVKAGRRHRSAVRYAVSFFALVVGSLDKCSMYVGVDPERTPFNRCLTYS